MKKFTKIALSALSLASVAAISIAGTVAYLTNTDADINVMTLGNVKIEQHEYERVTNADGSFKKETIDEQTSYVLQDFTQGKELVPIVGDPSLSGTDPAYAGWDTTSVRMSQVDSYGGMSVFAGKNAQDKFVTVENTGKTDAYVRTLVAIECGTGDAALIGTSYHSNWTKNVIGTIAVGGVNYYLIEYVYKGASDGSRHVNGVLPAGDTSYPNLSQIYIKSAATNEDMVALDGNGNGTLDVLVFSQAVQADGFDNADAALDAAFGNIDTDNHPWLNGTGIVVASPESGAVRPAGYAPSKDGEVIDNLVIYDNSDDVTNLRALYQNGITGDLTITNSYLEGTYAMNVTAVAGSDAVLTAENSAFRGWVSFSGFASASFTNCNFGVGPVGSGEYNYIRTYNDTTLTNCDLAGTMLDTHDEEGNLTGATITLVNCTYNGKAITADMLANIVDGDSAVVIG